MPVRTFLVKVVAAASGGEEQDAEALIALRAVMRDLIPHNTLLYYVEALFN